ncbi:MAG: TMEM175 family protein [Thermodesulfobacteriota bacterium]
MKQEMTYSELGKNRIEALSDGIFAIVMTLLILEIHVPQLPSNASNVQLAPALMELLPKFFSYAVSFIALGIYWVAHHNMYHAIKRSDRMLLWLNILFFMFVSILPFTTSLLNAFGQTQLAPLLFGANLTIIGWVLFIQWMYVTSNNMISELISSQFRESVRFRFLFIPVAATTAMLVCFWSVEILLTVYAILLPFYMISPKLAAQHETVSNSAT